jgi:hypothetical protein
VSVDADTDSEEKLKDTHFRICDLLLKMNILSGTTKFPLMRQMCTSFWENKTTVPCNTENSQPYDLFLLYFQTILEVNCTCKKRTSSYSQQINVMDLQTFLAVLTSPVGKLFSFLLQCDNFLRNLKYLHFMDNHKPPT